MILLGPSRADFHSTEIVTFPFLMCISFLVNCLSLVTSWAVTNRVKFYFRFLSF
uniref:Uncharacterized protein n=1 Tax=Phakopsora pachyrhizi TaxID=170000 RepID=A0A0S1MKB7_PHAPC